MTKTEDIPTIVLRTMPADELWKNIRADGPRGSTRQPYDHRNTGPYFNGLRADRLRQDSFRTRYSYAVPTPQAINRITAFADGPILEVGAGRGLWAHLIKQVGGTVRPTDIATTDTSEYFELQDGVAWTDIEPLDAMVAAKTATEKTLMFIWPSYNRKWVARALRAFKGDSVVYAGEGEDGCTGDDAFHELLHTKWDLADRIAIPQWPSLHDRVFLYRRKKNYEKTKVGYDKYCEPADRVVGLCGLGPGPKRADPQRSAGHGDDCV